MRTHTESWVNRLTVPVALLIKQWQLYYRPDKPDCAKRGGVKKRERKKGRRQRDKRGRRLKKSSPQNRPGRKKKVAEKEKERSSYIQDKP